MIEEKGLLMKAEIVNVSPQKIETDIENVNRQDIEAIPKTNIKSLPVRETKKESLREKLMKKGMFPEKENLMIVILKKTAMIMLEVMTVPRNTRKRRKLRSQRKRTKRKTENLSLKMRTKKIKRRKRKIRRRKKRIILTKKPLIVMRKRKKRNLKKLLRLPLKMMLP